MHLTSFWSADYGLSPRLCKNFPDCSYSEKIIFENLQQNYVCGLPKIKLSEYFGGAKAINIYILTDPLLTFHVPSNEHIGFWIERFSVKKIGNAQTRPFESSIWIHTWISRKLFVSAEIWSLRYRYMFFFSDYFPDHKIKKIRHKSCWGYFWKPSSELQFY